MSVEKEEALDPRIQIELEKLNTCTNEINKLETELDEVNGQFRTNLADGIQKLHLLHNKLGKCIDKAKPYYIARQFCRQAQLETQRAAVQYQRAVSTHQAAKETIRLAEQRFLSNQDEWEFDAAWQEMLNHATMKVMEAETNKTKSEQEHQKKAVRFAVTKEKLSSLEKQLKSVVSKSRPYFDMKDLLHTELESLKSRIYEIHKTIIHSKAEYAESLHNLEVISEQIHMRRKLLKPREPGVGAEKELAIPDIVLDDLDVNLRDMRQGNEYEDDSGLEGLSSMSDTSSNVQPSTSCSTDKRFTSFSSYEDESSVDDSFSNPSTCQESAIKEMES